MRKEKLRILFKIQIGKKNAIEIKIVLKYWKIWKMKIILTIICGIL
jgi:hypothetical protein